MKRLLMPDRPFPSRWAHPARLRRIEHKPPLPGRQPIDPQSLSPRSQQLHPKMTQPH